MIYLIKIRLKSSLEIYTQTKEEISLFLNQKLKKNPKFDEHLINSDDEFNLNDDSGSENSDKEEN